VPTQQRLARESDALGEIDVEKLVPEEDGQVLGRTESDPRRSDDRYRDRQHDERGRCRKKAARASARTTDRREERCGNDPGPGKRCSDAEDHEHAHDLDDCVGVSQRNAERAVRAVVACSGPAATTPRATASSARAMSRARDRLMPCSDQYAPRLESTAGIVRRMIEMSSQMDQFSR
jgi:hypothetical protein